jgi:hypothetical protein
MNLNPSNLWQLAGLGFVIVLIGVVLKDASGANTIITSGASAYTSTLSTLEKAG